MSQHPENDRASWVLGPRAHCSKPPESPQRAWRIVMLGAPGLGAGTQAELLGARLGSCRLCTDAVIRAAANSSNTARTPATSRALLNVLYEEPIADATIWEIVRERAKCVTCRGGFVFDGFPRTLTQAREFQQMLVDEGLHLDAVIKYDMSDEKILALLTGWRTCETCGAIFHQTLRPPDAPGVCDDCGNTLVQQDNDRPETVLRRLQKYHHDIAPVVSFYEKLALLIHVPADGTAEEIFNRTLHALESEVTDGRLRSRIPGDAIEALQVHDAKHLKQIEPL